MQLPQQGLQSECILYIFISVQVLGTKRSLQNSPQHCNGPSYRVWEIPALFLPSPLLHPPTHTHTHTQPCQPSPVVRRIKLPLTPAAKQEQHKTLWLKPPRGWLKGFTVYFLGPFDFGEISRFPFRKKQKKMKGLWCPTLIRSENEYSVYYLNRITVLQGASGLQII